AYLAFTCLAALAIGLAMRDNVPGLATLISPGFLLFGGWICMSVLLSSDPGTSMRRVVATLLVAVVTASLMLLPKNQTELARWFSIAALGLLSICYRGVLFVPPLPIPLARVRQIQQSAG